MKKIAFPVFFIILFLFHYASSQIKSGPMLGYSDMREVLLWVQTEKSEKVKFAYWEKGNLSQKFYTDEYTTTKDGAFVAKLIADQVLPSKIYEYEIYVNKKKISFSYPLQFQTQTLWQYRTDPPTFKFAVGSCVYTNEERFDRPGTPYGKKYEIFNKIYDQKPNFMVWGGDNIYLREPDWNTQTGINHRYSEFKKQKELQPLWANTHHYAIWDDHDYGPNDYDRSFWGKNMTLKAFRNFWANPNYIFENEAITGTFWWEDCQFFMMDNRWFRAPNELKDDNKDYYGEKQLNWLIDALKTSSAPFKFVVTGGQVVSETAVFENMANYPGERKRFLDKLVENNISGVLFISGDRHHTNIHKLTREGTYPLYDFTISPITSGAGKPTEAELKNPQIVEGTDVYNMQNFGIIEISGKRTDRMLKLNIFDAEGNPKTEFKISAKELKAKQ